MVWTPIFTGTILVFFCITGFWVALVVQLLQVYANDDAPPSLDIIANPSEPSNAAKLGLSLFAVFIADAMIVSHQNYTSQWAHTQNSSA